MDQPDVTNRRRVPRRLLERQIGVLLHGHYLLERSFQVGEGGMMISASRPLEIGERLVVTFSLTPAVLVIVRATVRSKIPAQNGLPDRVGLEFENLGFQFKREIRNFVAAATRAETRAIFV